MATLSYSLQQSLKPLAFMCLALLLTPNIVTVACLHLLSRFDLTVVLTRFPGFGTSPEIVAAALLAVATGMAVCLAITALSGKRPTLLDMVAIGLSQAFAFFLAIAALLHNPQEEFCKADPVGSALAKAFELESCSLTTGFWMQTGVGGLVAVAFFVLVLRIGRAFIQAVSN